MIVTYTKQELNKLDAIESKYEELIAKCEKEIASLRSDNDPDPDGSKIAAIDAKRLPEPLELLPKPAKYDKRNKPIYSKEDIDHYHATPEYQAYKAALDKANNETKRLFDEWEAKGSDEWRNARRRRLELSENYRTEINRLLRQCELRQFSELKGDPEKIIADAKNQITQLIANRYNSAKEDQKSGKVFSIYYLRVDGSNLCVDSETLIKDSKDLLKLHYDFFKEDPKATQAINDIVLDVITSSPYTGEKGILCGIVNNELAGAATSTTEIKDITNISTKAPKIWLTPVDKVSKLAFDGAGSLYSGTPRKIDISSRKTKKQILSMVSLDFNDKAIQITGRKELSPYDREVHDALVTLYIDGDNDYITPQMIYRAMTGNPKAKLTTKTQEAISNSVNKLLYSRLVIKASKEECEAYNFKSFTYEGTVIQGEKVTAAFKGSEVAEVYHLLKEPVLYTYASKKNQIGRLDIKLLDSPVNKNEENITLQSYLYRRILSMQTSQKLSRTILYDTVYKQLDIQAASDGALRKKKLKVRNTIKSIFDYWKSQGFILGYTENSRKNEIVSVTIRPQQTNS